MPSPILVTGSHRSGTTWVGQMLCASSHAAYIHEPFNPVVSPGWTATAIPTWYLYVTDENASAYRGLLDPAFGGRFPLRGRPPASLTSPRSAAVIATRYATSVADRLSRRRPLVKDPLAVFSTEWIVRTFRAAPVVMIRHPAAFAASLARLDWRFDFRNWLDQPLLLRDHLRPFEDEIRRHVEAPAPVDLIDEAALMWRVIYSFVGELRRRHPDWIFVRHEDLAADPVAGFADLYQRVCLPWNRRAERAIVAATSGADAEAPPGEVAPSRRDSAAIGRLWASRLDTGDVSRLRDAVDDVASAFYTDHDWLRPRT